MKKIWTVFLICLLFCGCGETKNEQESSPSLTPDVSTTQKPESTPSPTPEITIDSQHSENDETVNLGQDTEIVDELIVWDTALEASFVEETQINPTTLTFHLDGTVDTNLNVCSAMVNLSGEYTKEKDTVVLELKNTGYDFLDGVQFKFNLMEDKLMIDETSDMFSCSGVDTYEIRKVEE